MLDGMHYYITVIYLFAFLPLGEAFFFSLATSWWKETFYTMQVKQHYFSMKFEMTPASDIMQVKQRYFSMKFEITPALKKKFSTTHFDIETKFANKNN